MSIGELFRLVWLNLSQNKSKVILTSIGIVVGSATIMMVIAIGQGGQKDIAEQFKNLNAGAIDIAYEASNAMGENKSNKAQMSPGGGATAFAMERPINIEKGVRMEGMMSDASMETGMNEETVSLTQEDAEDLEIFVPGLSEVTISYTTNGEIEGGILEENEVYTIAGVTNNYSEMSNLELSIGEFLTEENEERKEKICILGANAAKKIFGDIHESYQSILYIEGRPYSIQGVLNEMGTVASGINPDATVFIPYATGIKYITGTNANPTITVIAEDVNQVDLIKEHIETVLLESYPNTEFTISDAGTKMEAASESNQTLTILLWAMAAIVFTVGGIGIMNVLFVSVKERTNEIGILKAIGCSRKDILVEFLLEAGCISLIGAVLGILVALGITPIIEHFSVRVELSFMGAMLSLGFGIITGSLFGFYPALKASRLIPVVALNQD